jgi:hypothetical protein
MGSLINGQSNLLVIGLLLAAVAGVADRRWNLASILAAAACLVKLYPIAVGLLLALLHPRRFGSRLAATLAVGFTVPFLLQEPAYVAQQYAGWMRHLREDDRQVRPRELWYRDVRLLDWMWGQPLDSRSYRIVQLTSAAAVAACCWYGARRRWPQRRLLTLLLALSCCWMTVVGPATEPSTYTLVAPSLAWATLEAWLERQRRILRGLLAVSYVLFMAYYLAGWVPFTAALRNAGPEALGSLLLLGCLLVTALRDMARARETLHHPPGRTGEKASIATPGRAA